jgi:branched-chain amino acid transport system substrate-binding protein
MIRSIRLTLVAAAAAFTAQAALADVNIGVTLSLTGPASGLGIPVHNYLKLFPERIAGEKVNLIILDDASDPGKGVSNARRFVTDDKVDLILGSSITTTSAAIAPVAAEARTVQLSVAPVGVPPAQESWVFRLPQGFSVMAHPIVEHMKKTGIKSVGFIGYTDAYGELWLKELQKQGEAAGIKMSAVERFARTDNSVTPQALKLVSANPDAILVVASGSGAAMPHKGLVERGYAKAKIYQTHGAATLDLIRVGGADVEGSFVSSGPAVVADKLPASNASKQLGERYIREFEKVHGNGSANQFGAHAFDVIIVLQKAVPIALKKGKPGTPEFRAGLKEAFETMGRTPVSQGVLNWTATDHFGYTPETGVLLKVVKGDWEVVPL